MTSRKSGFSMMVLIFALAVGCSADAEKEQIFKGEVGDSQCALNVHSLSRSHQ